MLAHVLVSILFFCWRNSICEYFIYVCVFCNVTIATFAFHPSNSTIYVCINVFSHCICLLILHLHQMIDINQASVCYRWPFVVTSMWATRTIKIHVIVFKCELITLQSTWSHSISINLLQIHKCKSVDRVNNVCVLCGGIQTSGMSDNNNQNCSIKQGYFNSEIRLITESAWLQDVVDAQKYS